MKPLLLLLLLVGSLPAATTFTGTGVSADINVSDQHTLAVTLSGTFVATVVLEQAVSGGYVPLQAWNTTVTFKPPRLTGIWRLRCTDYTSGTVTYTLTSVADNQVIYRKPNGSTAFSVDVDGLVTSAGGAISGGSIDNAPIGATTPSTGAFTTLSATGAITSTLATGTAPFTVASTTNVANLNASTLSGKTHADPGPIGSGTPSTGAFTTISATGPITSTQATGTAPFVVASTTNVANLNASSLGGATFAAPGTIGGGTPAAATFTTVTATDTTAASLTSPGGYTSTVATGTAPFTATSTTACPNLNASALLGGTWAIPGTIGSGTPNTGAFSTVTTTGNLSVAGAADPFSRGYSKILTLNSASDGAIEVNVATGQSAIVDMGVNASRLFTIVSSATATSIDAITALPMNLMTTNTTRIQIAAGGDVSMSSATDATSKSTGNLQVAGGAAITKNLIGGQGLGVGVASTVTAAATTTLTTASAACQVFTGTTTQTMTLPAANAFGAGVAYVVYVKNLSTGLVTVSRAGSDTINSTASNVTTFTLAQWASCALYSDGVSAWERF